MNKLLLLTILFIYYFQKSFSLNNNYPYNPNIHNLGNIGWKGKFHAKLANVFIEQADKNLYKYSIRERIINTQDYRKSILDIGCGVGYSTQYNPKSLGIDTSPEMIAQAKSNFPKKNFKIGHAEFFKSQYKFDIVTSMFLLHEVPQEHRINIIKNAMKNCKEKIIIVDIASNYKASPFMLAGEPYLKDYLKNIDNDLSLFTKYIIKENHVHMWVFDYS